MSSITPNTAANGGQILTDEPPKLPAPFGSIDIYEDSGSVRSVDGFTADQMRGYALDMLIAALKPRAAILAAVPASESVDAMFAVFDGDRKPAIITGIKPLPYGVLVSCEGRLPYKFASDGRGERADIKIGLTAKPAPAPAPVSGMPDLAWLMAAQREEFIRQVVSSVVEMDRDSPEDQPEMMLVTPEELRGCIESAFERVDEDCTLCNGMGMLDGSGATCPHCNGKGSEPVTVPLPAAPAPTRATAEQESEIDAAVKAGRITFEPGWDDPRPAPAPTEQAAKAIYRLFDSADEHPWIEGGNSTKQDDARRFARAALAARLAPTEAPNFGPIGFGLTDRQVLLETADLLMERNWRGDLAETLRDMARQAPDSRDAALEEAAALFPQPYMEYFGENIQADIRALKSVAQEKAQ